MGMFDGVNFSYRMPDGFESNGYQTKDLDCLLDNYTITKNGRLILESASLYAERPLGDVSFSGMLNIYDSDIRTNKWHEYDLEFSDGTLVAIHCHDQPGRLLFDPAQYIDDEPDETLPRLPDNQDD